MILRMIRINPSPFLSDRHYRKTNFNGYPDCHS